MKNKFILVVGYFGYVTNQLDGQTIKTRNIFELFKQKEKEHSFQVDHFDTEIFQTDKRNVVRMFRKVAKTDILIYIAGRKNLKFVFPFHYFISKIKKIDLHFIVVGGWLDEFLLNKPFHTFMLKRIMGIYPQTHLLTHQLREKYKFQNVYQLNNFRVENNISRNSELIPTEVDIFKMVFMARVHPLKGMDVLFGLAHHLKKTNRKNVVIDIYGPIFEEYQSEFEEKLEKYKNVRYKGELQPEDITDELRAYDLMLFPTKYYTEGFPGSILDAYIAGIPVIATRWKYAEEFILDRKNGLIADFNDPNDFIEKVLQCIENTELLFNLRKGVQDQAKNFSSESIWDFFLLHIFN